jgi:hypothetical protein
MFKIKVSYKMAFISIIFGLILFCLSETGIDFKEQDRHLGYSILFITFGILIFVWIKIRIWWKKDVKEKNKS